MSPPARQSFFADALARARERRAAHDFPGALRELRVGLDGPVDYHTAVKAAAMLPALPPGLPVRRIALVGADTLVFLQPIIRALAFRDGWHPEFYEAPFGTWRQEILDPHSALRKFKPEVTLVLRSWREAGLPTTGVDSAAVEHLFENELALARCAAEGLGLVLWPGFDFPSDNASGALEDNLPDRHTVLAEINQRLRGTLPPGILWVDLAELQSSVGKGWVDERLWQAVRQYPSAAGSVALVELWLALCRARWGQARKVLVTDLDNVLWGGIVGEDGMEGVRVGPGTEAGVAHAAYQQFLVGLKNRGVLLAVCSKNNEADVVEVFARRAMPLRRDDFAGWMVNWSDKADNLRALAEKLQLGLSSFVFVDDQPAERARVRAALPEVAVPEMPDDIAEYIPFLQSRHFFDLLTFTAEDRARPAAYRANQEREQLRAGLTSVEDFLQSLDMSAEHGPFSEATMERVEQLLARTNQWNLTTRRHGRAELANLAARPGSLTQWFRLKDRFGDNGLVGLWVAVPRTQPGETSAEEWEIDSWVMSCRVIGRGLEDLMFNTLVDAARNAGARRLHGVYRPTAKNALVAGLLPKLGFKPEEGVPGPAGEQTFVLDLAESISRPHAIRVGV